MPLLQKTESACRVVTVASRAGGLRILKSPSTQVKLFTKPKNIVALTKVMYDFIEDVKQNGKDNAYANTTYGMSKCGIIAWTRLMQKQVPAVGWSCMCPGWCKTSMTGGKGHRTAEDGAKTASWLALSDDEAIFKSGDFFADNSRIEW